MIFKEIFLPWQEKFYPLSNIPEELHISGENKAKKHCLPSFPRCLTDKLSIVNTRSMAKRMTTLVRREQIAEAALTLLSEQGLGGLTARNLAKTVGLTAPALYRHFPGGKENILASILDLLEDIKTAGLKAAHETPGTAVDKLRHFYDQQISLIQRFRALPCLLLSDTLWIEFPLLRDRFLKSYHAHQLQVEALVRHGQEGGEIRTDIGASQIFAQFFGQFLSVAVLHCRQGNMIDIEAQSEANWQIFVRGILP